ncbi:uncharacterized protein LOC122502316 [Leptopilina heterotoma]|uniref:uncharacterized protein LOC122502316 n=1 Tax=Leptopilina heterotoma TaxID=63436 RepID=UPI001CA7C8DE|nr:uncharacterized protein LOC122502316 [Leptopilina heterotoma]
MNQESTTQTVVNNSISLCVPSASTASGEQDSMSEHQICTECRNRVVEKCTHCAVCNAPYHNSCAQKTPKTLEGGYKKCCAPPSPTSVFPSLNDIKEAFKEQINILQTSMSGEFAEVKKYITNLSTHIDKNSSRITECESLITDIGQRVEELEVKAAEVNKGTVCSTSTESNLLMCTGCEPLSHLFLDTQIRQSVNTSTHICDSCSRSNKDTTIRIPSGQEGIVRPFGERGEGSQDSLSSRITDCSEHTQANNESQQTIVLRGNFFNVNILYQNTRGINSKLSSIKCFPDIALYDIICITESWLKPDTPSNEIFDSKIFKVFRHDRLEKREVVFLLQYTPHIRF